MTSDTSITGNTGGTDNTGDTGDAIILRSVSRRYGSGDRAVTALDQISLGFPKGTFTAVMGPSGSGKSTLLQCAAGLDRPTSGSVLLAGTELTGLSETKLTLLRRERVGFVFQSFNLLPSLTAEQNVALPLRLAGRRVPRSRLREVLRQVGLGERARHRPAELSGGQQQRVALARALVTGPEVLFGDEPTGALDSRTGREVLTLLRAMVDDRGQTTVMVTHDPVAASYADRVVFLVDGRVNGELTSASAEAIAARMTQLETLPRPDTQPAPRTQPPTDTQPAPAPAPATGPPTGSGPRPASQPEALPC
ncbi:ABC transporter ATP-binding protein [Streptomyces sp. NPDC048254]|uniref:ABC transporter ATP-binding protein n=1 Tax=Streptomyces sp. NPDC048254 TaxID=3365525 RepID=UPI00371E2A0D